MKLPNPFKVLKWLRNNYKVVTWAKIVNWVNSYIRMNKAAETEGASEDMEQFNYRVSRVAKISPKCLEGACVHCGCDTPDKFWEDAGCEQGCYGPWMPPEEWAKLDSKDKYAI